MGIFILPMGKRAVAPLRAVRLRTAALGLGLLMLVTLAGGLALGYQFGQQRPAVVADSASPGGHPGDDGLRPDRPAGRALTDRVGALNGRLIRLESEALTLAKRVGVLPHPATPAETPVPGQPGPAATALPEPAGGPFVPLASAGDLLSLLLRLEQDLDRIDATIARIAEGASVRGLERMAFPSLLPVTGRRISSGFGKRRDPFTERWARHTGIDIPAPRGTPIVASAGGRVRFAGYRAAYGNTVEIDHGNGLATRYAHASRLNVRRGDLVLPGQAIAAVGSTGRSTGAHLHFEVLRNGVAVEPRTYLGRGEL